MKSRKKSQLEGVIHGKTSKKHRVSKSPVATTEKKHKTKKKDKLDTNEFSITETKVKDAVGFTHLDVSKVEKAVSELLRVHEEYKESKKVLFDTEGDAVFLSVTCCRIADIPTRILRFPLPHSLVQETSDIALVVRDLQPKERRPDMDAVIQLHESRLLAQKVKFPIKVIPIRQIMTEYKTYEAKRRLSEQFNFILADTHISPRLHPLLGRAFIKKRLNPIPVKLDDPSKYKKVIENALRKTEMRLSSNGSTQTLQVGHTSQSAVAISENIATVADLLAKEYPGGWDNIRSLLIKTSRSVALPIYVAIRNTNDIVIEEKKKTTEPIKGEISTKMNTVVHVYPDGTVVSENLQEKRKASEVESDAESDEEAEKKMKLDEEEGKDDIDVKDKVFKGKSYVSDSEDTDADEAEEAYLEELATQEQSSSRKKKKAVEKDVSTKVIKVPKKAKTMKSVSKEAKKKHKKTKIAKK